MKFDRGDWIMDKLFYPQSIAIIGLSSKQSNIPRLVLENLIRWGYKGRILGVNPRSEDHDVNGIQMFRSVIDLPIIPDLVYARAYTRSGIIGRSMTLRNIWMPLTS